MLNAHELLRRDTVIMTLEAARWAEQFLAGEPRRGRGARLENGVEFSAEADWPSDSDSEDLPQTVEEETGPGPAALLQPGDDDTSEGEADPASLDTGPVGQEPSGQPEAALETAEAAAPASEDEDASQGQAGRVNEHSPGAGQAHHYGKSTILQESGKYTFQVAPKPTKWK